MADTPSTVLVLHNDEREASELRSLLEQNLACEASATWSGVEALRLLQAGHFDVLITDDYAVDLYIGDLIERATALPSPPQVLVLGGNSVQAAVAHYQDLGLCKILDKARPRTLLQAITSGAVWSKPQTCASAKSSAKLAPQIFEPKRPN
ncbi:MAG TPA: response regulator [Candidatus Acidoferrales bacterium]|jgi:CheY-like chemotaxis protein|nr:response regulator [Candidatus Acidoferrales bacterium]